MKVTGRTFKNITAKLGNMRKAVDFTIYPYKGGDTISIQSDRYFAIVNLRHNTAFMNAKGVQNATSIHVQMNPKKVECEELSMALKDYFWHNEGQEGGNSVITWRNEELYSK